MLLRGLSGILRSWSWEARIGWRRHLLFVLPAATLLLATVYIGAVRTHVYGHDIVHLLDGGWRILNGQRPHVDFLCPAGPVTYLAMAAGLTMSGCGLRG